MEGSDRMANILLKIAYDGSGFHGWQKQPGLRTVQGALEETLAHLCQGPVSLAGTSRTDAGVHAMGQCATLEGEFGIPTAHIPKAANNLLKDAMILGAEEKPEGFHARFSAVGKAYVYRFAVSPQTPIFLRDYACVLKAKPDTGIMAEMAKRLEGTRDFACFQAAGGAPRETTVRTIFGTAVREGIRTGPAGAGYETVEVEICGDGFLYNMARIIAGTLAEAGAGKFAPGRIDDIIESKNRALAGPTAPPQGLYLEEVFFDRAELEAHVRRARERETSGLPCAAGECEGRKRPGEGEGERYGTGEK